ncbi:MAG: helix-turn-helix transcriptional regulator [Clostridia bacterium]|nr:helix-turn-helix transcriptional regulator [Clostridia bacterium]
MEIFVQRLNKLLKENGVTRYRLAKEIGVSKQAVLLWCDGINEPKISYLKKLAEFFEVTADYLIGLEDEVGTKTR